ncbi:MAG: hypothetical protein QOH90_2029 [Actinomycetota bacterium]|nr:hypothetical protein [Actinomycetota bacterium]
MKELKPLLEELGYENVRTYIQSGNVVFDAPASKGLGTEIEKAISKAFDLDIPVVMRSRAQLKRVSDGNPFLTKDADTATLHVMFLAEKAKAAAIKTLDPDRSPPDEFAVKGTEVYLRYPNGLGRSKLSAGYIEKKLGVRGTVRNWRTVTKLLEMMNE